MSANPPLPRLFGPYVLTRQLASDVLGEVYRAGTASGINLKPFLLVRMFNGPAVNREAMLPAMENAVDYLEEVKGPAVAKGAVLGVVDDTPFSGIEYIPGRTLDQLIGGEGVALPIEHALLITEKILIALEAGKPYAKATGGPHGFLIPPFVSISNDGDTRTFAAGLAPGLLPSLKDPKCLAAFGSYIAPDVLASGKASPAGDIYSAAAILFEMLSGKALPQGAGADAVGGAVLALNGNSIPDDVKKLLVRGLDLDPARRATDVVAYRKDLGKLLYGGPYAPSTFNLAFFMHQHFEKAIEKERRELTTEEQTDAKALVQKEEDAAKASAAPAARVAPREVTLPSFGVSHAGETLGGTPIARKEGPNLVPIIGAIVAVAAIAGFFLLRGRGAAPEVKVQPTAPPVAAGPAATPTPFVPPTPVILGAESEAFKKALEAELLKARQEVEKKIEKEQGQALARAKAEEDKRAEQERKVKELEEARNRAQDTADKAEAARLAREADEARKAMEEARRAAEAAKPKTVKGQLVEDVSQVDRPPSALKVVKPDPTNLARQRHVNGTVLMRVLVNETGKPDKVEILRDTTPKVGLGDSCQRALEQWQWTPAVKDGVEVKTWIVVPIPFQGL